MPKGSAKTSPEDKLMYILTVLSYTDLPKPDYQAIKSATGQSDANVAQKKFKVYVEQAGFSLVDRQVIRPDGGESKADNYEGEVNTGTTKRKQPKPNKVTKSTTAAKSTSTKPAAKRARRGTRAESAADADIDVPNNERPKSSEVIELSDDEEENNTNGAEHEVVKAENPVADTEDADDIEREEHTETDDTDAEADQDRLRRSRARSRTVKDEVMF